MRIEGWEVDHKAGSIVQQQTKRKNCEGDVRHVSSLDRLSSRYLLALRRRARQRKRERVGLVLESVELSLGGEALTATCDVEERGGGGGRCTRQC